MSGGLQGAIEDVLARDACSGCGLCTRLDPSLRMELDKAGYLRPRFDRPSRALPDAESVFRRSCPGMLVRAPQRPDGAREHPLLGAYLGSWRAWAADPDLRYAGSSGGALSALHAWLLESGRAARVTGVAKDAAEPRRSVPVTIMTREQALHAAGSRYAPAAGLDNDDLLRSGSAVTAKPCEISALRQSAPDLIEGEPPLMLSFFCAGTPSQTATDTLLTSLGIEGRERVTDLRYRGNGWPGRFSATTERRTVSADYEQSWGGTLGPTTQWRCKMCPDGVGESADIVSADCWATDDRGYPVFVESDGMSALIARTERGRQTVLDAAAAGVLVLEPLPMEDLAAAQPLQTARRRYLSARMLGSLLAGRRPPRYHGFSLLRLAAAAPRQAVRVARGTFRRVRRDRGRRVWSRH